MIEVNNLSVRIGKFELNNVNLAIQEGNYAVLMGKTGCGKTTVLEAICGLRSIESGVINLSGRDVTRLKPAERGIGFVPQEGSIFTTMTVRKNIAFSLSVRWWSNQKKTERVNELANAIGIAHLLDRMPYGLSGGERQRIAVARALAFHPEILCLDEPLSALDFDTRIDMCNLLRNVVKDFGVTALHITHNRNEAARLADQIFVFEDKKIVEVPRDEFIEKQKQSMQHDFFADF